MDLAQTIRELEDKLLHGDYSGRAEVLENLLATDFREVNPDGKTVSRESVIQWLLAKEPSHRWEFADFQVQLLAPGLALATYHARQVVPEKPGSRGALHASLWLETSAKLWQLVFHQSTRVAS